MLWVAKGLGPGGMERLLVAHAQLGDRAQFDYCAAYLIERPNSLRSTLEEEGVTCVELGASGVADPRWVGRLMSLVQREHVDVVHVHSPAVASIVRPLVRAMPHRPGLVYTEHNSWADYRWPTRLANRLTYPLDDAQVAVSDAARNSAPPRLRRRVEHLPHGIDIEVVRAKSVNRGEVRDELGLGADTVLVGVVANLRVQKNYPLMLQVARRVIDAAPNVRFVALGHGPLRADLEAQRDSLGLGEQFQFLGHVPDAPRMMSAFDILALSSDHEGMPVSVMEAFALRLPVVVTAVGGLPDAVDETVGRIVAPRRADLLAAAIVELATGPALRAELGRGAGERAERFDARRAVRRLEQIYQQVSDR